MTTRWDHRWRRLVRAAPASRGSEQDRRLRAQARDARDDELTTVWDRALRDGLEAEADLGPLGLPRPTSAALERLTELRDQIDADRAAELLPPKARREAEAHAQAQRADRP